MTAACVESFLIGDAFESYAHSQLCYLCCISVKQELVDLLAKEKQVESELVSFKDLYERELCEARKQILSLQQKLEEQKMNCKCS